MKQLFISLLWVLSAGIAPAQEVTQRFGSVAALREITLRTTTDIAVLTPSIEAFLATRPDIAIRYEQWGSNDLFSISRQDCATARTGADIVISSGVHQIVRLVNDGCAATWISDRTLALSANLRWRDQVWGVSREPAVIIYNRRLVPPAEVPRTRFDLLDLLRPDKSRYAGRVATYDIEASGLGFLFAFMDAQEASTFGALMEAFARSGAVATCCSAEIIGGVVSGQYLMAYNVLGSYAAEIAKNNPDLGIVAPEDYTLVLSRAAYLPGKTANTDAAAFLDFLLSPEGRGTLAKTDLIASPGVGSLGSDPDDSNTRQRLIPLAPSLLVAMDQMKVERFLVRWRQAFAR